MPRKKAKAKKPKFYYAVRVTVLKPVLKKRKVKRKRKVKKKGKK